MIVGGDDDNELYDILLANRGELKAPALSKKDFKMLITNSFNTSNQLFAIGDNEELTMKDEFFLSDVDDNDDIGKFNFIPFWEDVRKD